jgi:copper chaperone CopZ
MKQSVFVISNMDCPTEEALIRKRLGSVPGIGELSFNLMARRLTVMHTLDDERPIRDAQIRPEQHSRYVSRSFVLAAFVRKLKR